MLYILAAELFLLIYVIGCLFLYFLALSSGSTWRILFSLSSIYFLYSLVLGWFFFFLIRGGILNKDCGGEEKKRVTKKNGDYYGNVFLSSIVTGVGDILLYCMTVSLQVGSSVYLLLPASLYDKLVGTGTA